MQRKPSRSPTLSEMMAIVAAMAGGIGLARAAQPGLRTTYGEVPWRWLVSSSLGGALLVFTVLTLRFLRSPPVLRRLTIGPGIVTCCVASAYALWACAWSVVPIVRGSPPPGFDLYSELARNVGHQVGVVLPACWVTMAASGSWRREASWHDSAGLVLGAYFIAAFWIAPLIINLSV